MLFVIPFLNLYLPALPAAAPLQRVKIPVAAWNPPAEPIGPDVSFSYTITSTTTAAQEAIKRMELLPLDTRYPVVGGPSGYSGGVHRWTFVGSGRTVRPRPTSGDFRPIIASIKSYVNRYKIIHGVPPQGGPTHFNVLLTRAAHTRWVPATATSAPGSDILPNTAQNPDRSQPPAQELTPDLAARRIRSTTLLSDVLATLSPAQKQAREQGALLELKLSELPKSLRKRLSEYARFSFEQSSKELDFLGTPDWSKLDQFEIHVKPSGAPGEQVLGVGLLRTDGTYIVF